MTAVRHVSSRDNPLLLRLRKLAGDPAAYRKQGELWLEGDHLCSAFLQRGGQGAHALISDAAWDAQPALQALARQATAVTVIPAALMAASSVLDAPPAIGFLVPWAPPIALQPGLPTLVLDRVQDAGNVGTMLRSAAAFGFGQVLALKGTAALWSPRVLRAGMGAHFALALHERGEAATLASLGVPLLAASPHAAVALHEQVLPWPCAWVLGHEGQGVAPELLAACAHTLRIPQPGGEESLNVAAAAAVCLYESARQRLTG